MLFHVEMDVRVPADMPADVAQRLKATELEKAQLLQRSGKWRHLWRIAGRWANISVFDVESVDELHDVISTLPLFPYMNVTVRALCRHPSSIHPDDR